MAFLGIGVANTVSLFRLVLAFGTLALLFYPTALAYWCAFVLTIVVIWLDGLDGYLARKLNESSKIGSVIDILSDRNVEQLYWVTYAVLGWVPLWVPLVVITRGIWVDGLRALAFEQGFTAFVTTSMMQHPLGVLLVSSRFSRWSYAVCKAAVFAFLILVHLPQSASDYPFLVWQPYTTVLMWVTVFFCVVRGLPVLLESRRFLVPVATSATTTRKG